MNSLTDPHGLTGAYALHALPDDERAAFARHLADCEPCRQETAEFAATAARLGLAATVTPGTALRERVLRRVTTVRQVPPTGRPLEGARRTGVRKAGGLSRWALAACLAAVTALGGTAVWQHERARDAAERAAEAEQGADALTGVLTAPDATSRTVRLPGGASGTLVASADRDRAVFLASGMAAPPRDKVYQLWFDDGGTMRSAGLMDPGRTGQAVLMRGPVNDAAGVGITVEPAGGSKQPTSEPIVLMEMPA